MCEPSVGWRGEPRRWRLQGAHAAWLVQRDTPRVVVTFMDDTFLTPFLRRELAAAGGRLVNVAHTICVPSVDFSMCDVDWLVLFGERSLRNLRATPVRYGDCGVVIAGSPYLADGFAATRPLAPPGPALRLVWIAQYLHPARREVLRRDLRSLVAFARSHPGYPLAVRLHPLDRGETGRELAPIAGQVRWIEGAGLLPEMMGEFDVAMGSFSAGLIDAAACGKPIVAFSTSGFAEWLGVGDAGLPLVRDGEELAAAIAAVGGDYEHYSGAALALARSHYYALDDATPRIVRLVETICAGGDPRALGLPHAELRGAGV
jgi:hypothetical protein